MRLSKIPETLSLSEQISRQLGEAIIAGEYQPGDSITEKIVSDLFQVSRAPVREAFRILERDGVLQIIPRHGARVTELSYDDLLDAFEVRAILFGAATGQYAAKVTDERLAEFGGFLSELATLVDIDDEGAAYNRRSAGLSSMIIDNCSNRRMMRMFHQLDFQVGRYRRLGLATPEMRRHSLDYWQRLYNACKAGDITGAEMLGREMISRTREAAKATFADKEMTGP
ncbi:GntR family transcriptional regulator [Aquamicrobium sp. LC103]|uniref:GntR family transcriptional regulator n=1 Tax=Aquamicrobium sp. LC103 TaxID=1120658 RepID=UPI00069C992E|nr:GntR family transcriptional regulator [Aquamicrobium sp. LC103]TKT69901.1 GntR family transcriptional regulator [Aquamicrobium sp. LC103]